MVLVGLTRFCHTPLSIWLFPVVVAAAVPAVVVAVPADIEQMFPGKAQVAAAPPKALYSYLLVHIQLLWGRAVSVAQQVLVAAAQAEALLLRQLVA
jgi:hypothetical protein